MKRLIIICLIITGLTSCTDEDVYLKNTELIGKWKLIEHYLDPGDGSGTFMPVNSKKTIEFSKKGIVKSNGTLCTISSETGRVSLGIFNDKDGTITPKIGCNSSGYKINYKLVDGKLQLWYLCIEGCAQKFEKISN
ncbi:hypothetical protein [Aureibaculum conchae]|uniref:hypothetical protein n=1 Tax=Aureibaculum sp. 2308TA14-22 TaxID=3108392 RepID=UPI0033989A94